MKYTYYNCWYSQGIIDIDGSTVDRDWIMDKLFPNYKYRKECIYNIKK